MLGVPNEKNKTKKVTKKQMTIKKYLTVTLQIEADSFGLTDWKNALHVRVYGSASDHELTIVKRDISVKDNPPDTQYVFNRSPPNYLNAISHYRKVTPNKTCAVCEGTILKFEDALSEQEYFISKTCQECQNKMFKADLEVSDESVKRTKDFTVLDNGSENVFIQDKASFNLYLVNREDPEMWNCVTLNKQTFKLMEFCEPVATVVDNKIVKQTFFGHCAALEYLEQLFLFGLMEKNLGNLGLEANHS
jgi:hypothetical protein